MKKMLVVVDYQNDFVDGNLGFEEAKALENGIYEKVQNYITNDDFIIFTYDTHLDDYLETREGRNLPVSHCIDGSNGHKLYGKLEEFSASFSSGNILINRNILHIKKYSFGVSPKDMCLIGEKFQDVEVIEIVGVVTDICVVSNAVMFQSQYINSSVIVDASLCASNVKDNHSKALDVMCSLQVNVINS